MEGIPTECVGCGKRGMEAIACPILSQVPQDLIYSIQCRNEHQSKEARTTTGGVVLGRFDRFNKAKPKNTAGGRKTATFPRSGSN